ncbi:MAG: hypothetical protein LBQ54_03535 [Planctomycetaceae bacterium]|nr:hypothetical protein [Planctomycetaceae bacterium]
MKENRFASQLCGRPPMDNLSIACECAVQRATLPLALLTGVREWNNVFIRGRKTYRKTTHVSI